MIVCLHIPSKVWKEIHACSINGLINGVHSIWNPYEICQTVKIKSLPNKHTYGIRKLNRLLQSTKTDASHREYKLLCCLHCILYFIYYKDLCVVKTCVYFIDIIRYCITIYRNNSTSIESPSEVVLSQIEYS